MLLREIGRPREKRELALDGAMDSALADDMDHPAFQKNVEMPIERAERDLWEPAMQFERCLRPFTEQHDELGANGVEECLTEIGRGRHLEIFA